MMNEKNNILSKTFLLYGRGISNISIQKYFDENNVKYDFYDDNISEYKISLDNKKYDYIIKSPSVLITNPIITKLKSQVISDLELFYLLTPSSKTITITGSSAKSTVATILNQVLDSNLCGNIGTPLFDYINSDKLKVIEASSYMLEATNLYRSNLFIITNFFSNHLDHHKTIDEYLKSKTKVLFNMTKYDYLIYDSDVLIIDNYIKANRNKLKCQIIDIRNGIFKVINNTIYVRDKQIYHLLESDIIKLKNISNLLIVLYTYYIYTLSLNNIEEVITKVLSYNELKYRLNLYNVNSLLICNDSKCTNILSLKNSLDIFKNYNIYLIIGGIKRSNHDLYKELIDIGFDKYDNIKKIYIYGLFKKDIYNCICQITKSNIELIDIFSYNFLSSIKEYNNSILLFSPGFPSTDLFKNYIERGKFFDEMIKNMEKSLKK